MEEHIREAQCFGAQVHGVANAFRLKFDAGRSRFMLPERGQRDRDMRAAGMDRFRRRHATRPVLPAIISRKKQPVTRSKPVDDHIFLKSHYKGFNLFLRWGLRMASCDTLQ
ncbi:hypothetical protein [Burkholderia sp. MSMB1072]|uniref:hypothetical protein n=1 Tax=Burkholderia sp. MSMB1072 TaxID=1637871 RepID=UPI0015D0B026|nr:hypothetical protein [Burkholderia sp. MSMB1072]